jgi:small conductance mechanosensitive channel
MLHPVPAYRDLQRMFREGMSSRERKEKGMEAIFDRLVNVIDVEELSTKAVGFLPDIFAAALILLFFWSLFRLTRGSLKALLRRVGFHETLVRMLVDSIFRITLFVFALIMAASQIGINVGAALAGLGVAGLALSFAAQDSLANIIAGFLVFIDKPFEVGDRIRVADQYGKVSSITMRSTRIRTNNNTYVIIPNKKIIDEVLVNHSKHGETRVEIPLGIAYKEDIRAARPVLLAALQGIEGILEYPAPDVVVTELGDSSVNMHVRVWISDADQEMPVFFRVMEACKLALDEAGIEIPFPHLQLFLENIEDRVWEKAGKLAAVK